MSVLDQPGSVGGGPEVLDLPEVETGDVPPEEPLPPRRDDGSLRAAIDVTVVAACAAFVFWQLHPQLLLADTTPAGGDMGAHVWAFGYLRDVLLPSGRLVGWTPDWYAGFPVFQYYMVVPFLVMVVVNAGLSGVASILAALASLGITARAAGARRVRPLAAGLGVVAVVALVGGVWSGYATGFRFVLGVVAVTAAITVGRRGARWSGASPHRWWLVAGAVVVALGGISLPFGPSFKIVTVAGVVGLPVSAYVFGKLSRFPYPTPALLAVASVWFLFDKDFTIYGGNIASTMAGEFAFSISLTLAVAYLGVLAHGLRTGQHRAGAAVLLALVGLCHLIPAFFAIGATAVMLAVHLAGELGRPRVRRFGIDRVWWLASVGVVGALLAAWWVLPFYARTTYLNDMGWEKIAVHHEGTALWHWFTSDVWSLLVPGDLRIPAALALVGAVLSILFRNRIGSALVIIGLGLAAAFVFAPQGRLWNARLLPFWYLVVYLMAAVGVGEVARALGQVFAARPERPVRAVGWVAAPVCLLALGVFLGGQLHNLPGGRQNADGSYRLLSSIGIPGVFSLDLPDALGVDVAGRNFVTDWSRWNYSGYERKDAYPEYRAIVSTMEQVGEQHGCGMSLWEYSSKLNDYGTPMALMLLPHWTDGCIGSMEGLYFEASSTTPFHFLMQSELSQSPSRAQRDLPYRDLDLDAGVQHLQLMGVKYYLARSPEAIAAADTHPALSRIAASGPWVVYEVADAPRVAPLAYQPAVTTASEHQDEWLCATKGDDGRCSGVALDWFQDPSQWDVELAANGPDDWQRVDPGETPERRPVAPATVDDVTFGRESISFTVDHPGTPVLVKESYFPNWRVSGADGPYRVAPNLMVVVPTDTHVTLTYGRTGVDYLAILLTLIGIGLVVALVRAGDVAVPRLRDPEVPFEPNRD